MSQTNQHGGSATPAASRDNNNNNEATETITAGTVVGTNNANQQASSGTIRGGSTTNVPAATTGRTQVSTLKQTASVPTTVTPEGAKWAKVYASLISDAAVSSFCRDAVQNKLWKEHSSSSSSPAALVTGAEVKGVKLWLRKVEGSPFTMVKGLSLLNVNAQIVAGCINLAHRKNWDDLFLFGRDVVTLHSAPFKEHKITYMAYKAPVPVVANRDVVMLVSHVTLPEDGTIVIKAASVTHPAVPPNMSKGFVRAEIGTSGFVIKPINDSQCELIYTAQINPKGWIPPAVINLLIKRQMHIVNKLHAYAKTVAQSPTSKL
eukprot:TRINITY_DN67743_c8_g2_i1.p1 TRINITY_DN67743_c8_g2~~TRINITY_DN67743_c8_g2_i1.p1  ORF type:complete len:319 (+),score=44.78 TRINITY_DN67743_c8_g2_i1:107-1063(+)